MKGYFKAPETGSYKFTAVHDDGAALYIQTTTGSAEANTTAYWSVNDYTSQDPWATKYASATGDAIALNAGDHIYMELYHLNTAGAGFVKLNA